jgi:hypothetical protein
MVGKELAKKDKLLMNIEKDQQKIKELLSGIYTEIKENKNRYNDLYEEFKSSFQPAQQIKEEQLKKLRFLLQTNDLFYLETNKNNEKVFNDFKLDQRTILDKIEEIEREIKIFN